MSALPEPSHHLPINVNLALLDVINVQLPMFVFLASLLSFFKEMGVRSAAMMVSLLSEVSVKDVQLDVRDALRT